MKRILCVALSILMLTLPLTSCLPVFKKPQKQDTEPPVINTDGEPVEKKLELIKDGQCSFSIIYASSNAAAVNAADSLLGRFYTKFGVEPHCVKDTLVENTGDIEILIGLTNRQESLQAAEKLARDNDYICELSGNKLVLIGLTDESTVAAVEYFINKYIDKNEDGNELIFLEYYNFHFTDGYTVNLLKCGENNLKDYRIVYPKDSVKGEYFLALDLRQYLYYNAGLDIAVIDDSQPSVGKEIIIGKTNREGSFDTAEKKFSVAVKNGNLHIGAHDVFGYIAADSYLKYSVFNSVNKNGFLTANYSYTGECETNPERCGDYRVMFANCWGLPDIGFYNRDEYASAYYLAYRPDVIALNEFWDAYRSQKVLAETLKANGYVEVDISAFHDKTNTNVLPIFYDPARVKLVDHKYTHFKWYGNASLTTLTQADDSKGVTIAVFEGLDESGKGNGERFIVCNTHLTSNYLDGKNGWTGHGYASRMLNIDTCYNELQPFLKAYPDASVLIGCDFNSTSTSDECKKLFELGFSDCQNTAELTNNICSSHGYPEFDETLGYFTKGVYSPTATADSSIDHIFQYGSTIDTKLFCTLTTYYTALFSDHSPLLVDFNVTADA